MLTQEEKQKALHYLMFLKKKRSGSRIKGHGCADGRKEYIYKTNKETSSLKVATESTESLTFSSIINAKER
jgi:hypothetical protein